MKIVTLFGFALWFLSVGVAVGLGAGVAIAGLVDRSAAAYLVAASGLIALVLIRRATSLAVRAKPSEVHATPDTPPSTTSLT